MSEKNKDEGRDRGDLSPEDRAAFERRVAGLEKRLGDVKAREKRAADVSRDRGLQGRGMAYGLRMASELVAAVLVGGLIGYGLDYFLGTKPWIFLVMLLLGFAAGVRNVVRGYGKVQGEMAQKTGGDIGRPVTDDDDD